MAAAAVRPLLLLVVPLVVGTTAAARGAPSFSVPTLIAEKSWADGFHGWAAPRSHRHRQPRWRQSHRSFNSLSFALRV